MLRSTATRFLFKNLAEQYSSRFNYGTMSFLLESSRLQSRLNSKRPQAIYNSARPALSYTFYATKSITTLDNSESKLRTKLGDKLPELHSENISSGSSERQDLKSSEKQNTDDGEMLGGIKADLVTIKDTFALTDVPKESLYLGAAGVLPYAATSLSTVFLASEIKHAHSSGSGYLFSADTAHQMLEIVTPIQIGYGAVIISFLGAIHWGLEYAGYGGYHSYRRYIYGVIAPAVAWPTMFMPVEYALITQFAVFNFLYFADARATVRGWFPPWYSTYRFVLTFFVGASIVISLVGRGQIVSHDANLRSPVDYIKKDRDSQWEALEREEKERRKILDDAGEDSDNEEGGENDSENAKKGVVKEN